MLINYGSLPIYEPEELFVIADIHGENERLERILDRILPELENKNNHLVFCGDYADGRGPSSPKVLLRIIEIKKLYPDKIFCIRGNHEDMLWGVIHKKMTWFNYTEPTLKQMMLEWSIPHNELKPMSYIPEIYSACEERGVIDFYKNLLPYYETPSVICTHAPLDRGMCEAYGLRTYQEDFLEGDFVGRHFLDRMNHELMWGFTNEEGGYSKIDIEKLLVCGHQFKNHREPRLFKGRVFLDTGCGVVPNKPLVALRLPGKKVIREKN